MVRPDGVTLDIEGEPNTTATAYGPGDTVLGTTQLDDAGKGVIVVPPSNGGEVIVTLTDAADNVSPEATVTVPDTAAPAAPGVSVGDDGVTLTISGEPGTTATIVDDGGSPVATVDLGEDGTAQYEASPSDGATWSVTLSDAAGNTSGPTAVVLPDTLAPAAPDVTVGPDGLTLDIVGEPGATATAYDPQGEPLGSVTLDEDGLGQIILGPSNGGEVTVRQADTAGNESLPATVTVPDTAALDLPLVTVGPDGVTLIIEGEPGATATAYDPEGEIVGTTVLDEFGDGEIVLAPSNGGEFTVRLNDDNGNMSPEAEVAVPDTLAPAAPVVTVDEDGLVLTIAGEPGATVTLFDEEGSEVDSVVLDGSGNGTITLDPSNGGAYEAIQTDGAGNSSEPAAVAVPDTLAPAAPGVTVDEDGLVLTIAGEPGTTATIRDGNGDLVAEVELGEEGTIEYPVSPSNGATWLVTLSDAAGNTSGATPAVLPDTLAPSAPLVTIDPTGLVLTVSGEPGATVTLFDEEGVEVDRVVLDGSGNGTITLDASNGGAYEAIQTDAAGNDSEPAPVVLPDTLAPAAPVVTVDEDGLVLTITGEPGATVTLFDEEGNEVDSVVLDGSGSGTITLDASNGGTYEAIQTDGAGNSSEPAAVTVPDTLAPNAPVVTVDEDGLGLTIAGEPGTTATIRNGNGDIVAEVELGEDGSAEYPVSPSNGATWSVTLSDAAGNTSGATLAVLPDTLAPEAPGVAVGDDGVTLSITGEPGAVATAYDQEDKPLGSVTLDENGEGEIVLPASDGGPVDVVQADAAGNASLPTTVTLPDTLGPETLLGVADAAVLQHIVEVDPEPTPSTDSDSQYSLLDLGVIGSLLTLDIGSGYPLVHFDVDTGTNAVTLTPSIGDVLNLELLGNYVLIIEVKDEFGRWNRYEGDAQYVEDGLLRLDLLGLLGTSNVLTLRDFPAGEYRAALVPDPTLVTVGLLEQRTLEVTATDLTETHTVTVVSPATGNYLEAATAGDTANLVVTKVTFNGIDHDVPGDGSPITGAFGSLTISADGTYTYTPAPGTAGIGVDTFTVTVVNPVTGTEQSGTLQLGSQFGTGEASSPLVANDDYDTGVLTAKPEWSSWDPPVHEVGTTILQLLGLLPAGAPKFEFTVEDGQSVYVDMTATFVTVLGVATTGFISVQKLVGTDWVTYESTAAGGLLDLLGAAGTSVSGRIEVTEPGQYRIYGAPKAVLVVGTVVTLDAQVIEFDHRVIGDYATQTANGNVLDDNDTADSTTLVIEVNGEPVGTVSGAEIPGAYGTLSIDVFGNYTYTPNKAGAGIGQVDSFTYTIRNAAGATDTATLHIRIDSPGVGLVWNDDDRSAPAEITIAANDDEASAAVASKYIETPTSGTNSVSFDWVGGNETREASFDFTVEADTVTRFTLTASMTGLPSGKLTFVLKDDQGNVLQTSAEFNISGGNVPGAATLTLTDIPPGDYTASAIFFGGWAAGSLTLNGVGTVTHLLEFEPAGVTSATGNVLTDDVQVSSFVKLLINDGGGEESYLAVTSNAGTIVEGAYGTLTIYPDGSYSYVPDADLEVIGADEVFSYRLEHPNGQHDDEATLTIHIGAGDGPYAPMEGFMAGGDTVSLMSFAFEGDDDGDSDFHSGFGDAFDLPELTDDSGEIELPPTGDDAEEDGAADAGLPGGDAPADVPPVDDPLGFIADPEDDLSGTGPVI